MYLLDVPARHDEDAERYVTRQLKNLQPAWAGLTSG
jgi:hypothetical protein